MEKLVDLTWWTRKGGMNERITQEKEDIIEQTNLRFRNQQELRIIRDLRSNL